MLPHEFWASHDLTLELYGPLQHFLAAGEEQGIFLYEFQFRDPGHAAAIEGLEGEALWQCFEDNGYPDVLKEAAFRYTVAGVLADLLTFVYEGLQASAKGKLAVAYTSFRKPIRDDLFILEWLLADRAGYLEKFFRDPKEIDVSRMTKDQRIEIIGKAQDRTPYGRALPPEFLPELRFDKDAAHGFDGIRNRAIHIATDHNKYRTEAGNLNFVFSGDEDRQEQWAYLYHALPVILFHAVGVVESLMATFAPDFQAEDTLTSIRRTLRYLLWVGDLDKDESLQCAATGMEDLLAGQSVQCTSCGTAFDFDTEGVRAFVERGELRCPGCGLVASTEGSAAPLDAPRGGE